jgi:hypothetical protein
VSGRQNREQHSSASAQARPSVPQAAVVAAWQRETPAASGRQASAALPQQSALIAHRSPSWWQPMAWQRATPSGPAAHLPEQQFASTAQRSPSEPHPPTSAQRMGPCPSASGIATHEPEQQSLSPLHVSLATRHPGSDVHVGGGGAGDMGIGIGIGIGIGDMQRPLQQSPG